MIPKDMQAAIAGEVARTGARMASVTEHLEWDSPGGRETIDILPPGIGFVMISACARAANGQAYELALELRRDMPNFKAHLDVLRREAASQLLDLLRRLPGKAAS